MHTSGHTFHSFSCSCQYGTKMGDGTLKAFLTTVTFELLTSTTWETDLDNALNPQVTVDSIATASGTIKEPSFQRFV